MDKNKILAFVPELIGASLGVGSFFVKSSTMAIAMRIGAVGAIGGKYIFKAFGNKTKDMENELPEVTITPGTSNAGSGGIIPIRTNKYTSAVKKQNTELWNSMTINENRLSEIDSIIKRIMKNRSRYERATMPFKMPWYFMAIISAMEGAIDFTKHVHNGDPLTGKTVNVPKGRPLFPPANGKTYIWEESLFDVVTYTENHKVTDWTIPHMLWRAERYNGLGPRYMGKLSAYLWSFSNLYTKGKYISDGVYDDNFVSKQAGFAVILKRMIQLKHIKPDLA